MVDDESKDRKKRDLKKIAFDEMNLMEMPFSLLTDNRNTHKNPVMSLPLSTDGNKRLVASSTSDSLPTAMAERVVLALLWLTKQRIGFKTKSVEFSLRELVEDFMYPGKFKGSVSGQLMARVEKEIHRIKDTNIITDKWYDKRLGKHTYMKASILDYIQVVEEGGKGKRRRLQIGWGEKLFNSIQEKYTKAIDLELVLQIRRPLDLRLYRWLDRQLYQKDKQFVASCQNFGRFKIGMHGKRIEAGGKTASSYITTCIEGSLKRLSLLNYGVRLTVDKSKSDYSFLFEKLAEKGVKIVKQDQAADLVRRFMQGANNLTESEVQKLRIIPKDRTEAMKWLEAYGFDMAMEMIKVALENHQTGKMQGQKLLSMKGLLYYQAGAFSAVQARSKKIEAEKRKQFEEDGKDKWDDFIEDEITKYRSKMNEEESEEIKLEAKARADLVASQVKVTARSKGILLKLEEEQIILDRAEAPTKEEYIEKYISDRL